MSEHDFKSDEHEKDGLLEEKYLLIDAAIRDWINLIDGSPNASDGAEYGRLVVAYIDARIAEKKTNPSKSSEARERLRKGFSSGEFGKTYTQDELSGDEMVELVLGLAEGELLRLLINPSKIKPYLKKVVGRTRNQILRNLEDLDG